MKHSSSQGPVYKAWSKDTKFIFKTESCRTTSFRIPLATRIRASFIVNDLKIRKYTSLCNYKSMTGLT